ncbi:MAG: hypothetical protein EHM91_07265 [Planctomycetota bacterium]|nr:MAG: hypothetical protein EHM91_07265 [Planctomycetota bacterium]
MHALLIGLFSSVLTVGLLADIGKNDVKRLLQAGIGEQTIVEFIRKNAPADPLTVDDITELRNAGATDAVINAMLEVSRASDAVTRSSYGQPDNSYSNGTTVVEGYAYPAPSYSSYSYYYPYSYYPYSSYYYRPYRCYPYNTYNYYYPRYPYSSYHKYPYYSNYSRYPNTYYRPYSTAPYRHGYYPYSSGTRYSTPSYSIQPYRSTQQYRGTHQSAPRMSAPAQQRHSAPAPRSAPSAPRGGAGQYRR